MVQEERTLLITIVKNYIEKIFITYFCLRIYMCVCIINVCVYTYKESEKF